MLGRLVLAVLLLVPGSWAAAREPLPEARATELLGKPVVHAGGGALGEVQDLILELNGERVAYVVVGEKKLAYPVTAVKFGERSRMVAEPLADPVPAGANMGISTRELLGREVQHVEGMHLGDIKDFVFSPATGYVHQVIVELSGGAERAIPSLSISLPAAPGARAIVTGPARASSGSTR